MFLVAAMVVAGLWPPGASAQRLTTGVAYVGNDPLSFQRVKDAGAGFVHIWLNMDVAAPRVEPDRWHPEDPADPNYDWTTIDSAVLGAVQAGLTPVVGIYGLPAWAQRCHGHPGNFSALCDPDPNVLAKLAKAAATRFSGYFGGLPRVRYWQGLNEPNLSYFFNPQFSGGKPVSPDLYRRLINAFYAAVKSVNQSNLVLAAGLGPIARPGSTIGPMRFARQLLCMTGRYRPRPTPGNCEGGVSFDIFDIHPYTTGGPTHRGNVDDVQLGDLWKLQELLGAADRAGRIHGKFSKTPLWITEFSWDSKPSDPGGLPPAIAVRWAAHAIYEAWKAGVSNFFWFSLYDDPPSDRPFSQTLQSGLYFHGSSVAEARPKKILHAFQFPFVAFPSAEGFKFWGRTPSSRGGAVQIQIQDRGSWRTAAVSRANGAGLFEGTITTSYGLGGGGSVRARYMGQTSVPFSLREVKDFYQPPFG